MRLSKIKLVGFKSFVEPAVLHLPSNLVGVVGPNGCGKSNIIDAVRWVMGESSARSLRGENMSDVIFNGSASRKAVEQAAIELVFDNSAGRLTGLWANCAEIAVRRVLGRNGQSSYFLNGNRCRRRDIADLFLGTGLGARSYAIIEQGMISRVIEARPEDLRLMLEEAAGISKYKERRRETETRIAHARENLERFNDVRDALRRQLQHLQRQAKAATQYQEYRATEQRLRTELLTRRWHELHRTSEQNEQALHQGTAELEGLLAEQQRLATQLHTGRERSAANYAALQEAQQRYYQAEAALERLQQHLQHQREVQRRHDQDVQQTLSALQEVETQQALDAQQAAHLHSALANTELEAASLAAAEAATRSALTTAETAWREVQSAWDAGNQRLNQVQQQIEVERTRIEHGERHALQGERRLQRLDLEYAQLSSSDLEQEAAQLQERYQECVNAVQQAEAALAHSEATLNAIEEQRQPLEQQLRAAREYTQTTHGRLSALRTLQEAARGGHDAAVNAWLSAQGLSASPRLVDHINAQAGWEAAAESVLAPWLDAVCVNDLQQVALSDLPAGQLTLLELGDAPAAAPLANQVFQAPWPVPTLLPELHPAANLEAALAQRATLPANAMLITPEGICCGRYWLRLHSAAPGVLERGREIHELESSLRAATLRVTEQAAQLEQLSAQRRTLEQQRRTQQLALNQAHQQQARAQAAAHTAQARCAQAAVRLTALSEEHAEVRYQSEQEAEQAQQARRRLEQALAELEATNAAQTTLQMRRAQLQSALQQARAAHAAARQAVAAAAANKEKLRVQSAAVQQGLQRLTAQRQQLQQRQQELAQYAPHPSTTSSAELSACQTQRRAVAAELEQMQQCQQAHEAHINAAQQQRTQIEEQVEAQRLRLEEQRLAVREARIKEQVLREQLQELNAEPENIWPSLAAGTQESELVAALQQVERRIQRLGAINLAALDECAELEQRGQYLDAQHTDLLEALHTLESAMRKIDRETRARLRSTFGQVNAGLQQLFPRLFGGGEAHLQLTGEDVLDAGVTIMAKPPGKRISAISLLSGGEKALTAVALVFAIFQLNPAPFCLLDEVDAPLDDANVRRFGALVQEMAQRVQFIFITHNKATMEIAEHLAGVTMQEPGVSRLVAVDVAQALHLAGVA